MARQCKTDGSLHRRLLLEDSLLQLLRTRRYADVSVKDVCDQANIPRRTFYHYFESKDNLLDSVIENTMLPAFLAARFEFESGYNALRQSFVRFFRHFDEANRERLSLLLANGHESRLIAFSTQWALSEMLPMPQSEAMTPEIVSLAPLIGTASFFTLLFHWCRNGFRDTPEEMAGYVVWFLTQPLYEV